MAMAGSDNRLNRVGCVWLHEEIHEVAVSFYCLTSIVRFDIHSLTTDGALVAIP
jgi:hypothetical protein